MKVVNENSRAVLAVAFFDTADQPDIPVTVEYRIDDQQSGEQLRDWTSIGGTMAAEMSVALTSQDSRMVNNTRPSERRVVTFRADYDGVDDENYATAEYVYEVRNLRFLS